MLNEIFPISSFRNVGLEIMKFSEIILSYYHEFFALNKYHLENLLTLFTHFQFHEFQKDNEIDAS